MMANRGFSLVELMVSVAVGTILMLLVGQMLTSNLIGRDRALGVAGLSSIASSLQSYLGPTNCKQVFGDHDFSGLPTSGWPVVLDPAAYPANLTDINELVYKLPTTGDLVPLIAKGDRVNAFVIDKIAFTRAIQHYVSPRNNPIDLLELTITGTAKSSGSSPDEIREIKQQIMFETNAAGVLDRCSQPSEWQDQKACEDSNALIGSWSSIIETVLCLPNIKYSPL